MSWPMLLARVEAMQQWWWIPKEMIGHRFKQFFGKKDEGFPAISGDYKAEAVVPIVGNLGYMM